MSKVVGIGNVADAIADALQEYSSEVSEGIEEEVDHTRKEVAKAIRKSPDTPELTGEYRKGWTSKPDKTARGAAGIVHNRTDWQLTHLLEKGHAKVGGGRVPAKPHIGPIWEREEKEFEKRVEKIIEKGGRA